LENAIDFLCALLLTVKVLLFLSVFIHAFPLISRFRVKNLKVLENSLALSVTELPKTVLLILIVAVSLMMCSMELLLLGVIPAATVLIISYILEPIYQKYYQETDLDGSNGILDPWYDNEKC